MGQFRDYIIHDDSQIKGFFGEYRWLSNYHLAPIHYDMIYPSSEHLYQALKTNDLDIRKEMVTLSCKDVRLKGQTIETIPKWEEMKWSMMYVTVYYKFRMNPDLRKKLIATGDKYLEETNHWNDTFYGVCNGIGENNLGKILMRVRERLTYEI